ncbi:hypothetical protein ACQKO5_17585 [Novosphingobium subterraneum]|uniref:hypothetical protein n=1 Tax=Novosphingobium subterraneum TaxID=48936 RepID=UPI003D0501D8
MIPSENETWLIDTGDAIIQKKAAQGRDALTACERLIHCVWVADYSMRNAGDLIAASDLYPPFRQEAAQLAGELGLARTKAAFCSPAEELERMYFDAFNDVCAELQNCLTA